MTETEGHCTILKGINHRYYEISRINMHLTRKPQNPILHNIITMFELTEIYRILYITCRKYNFLVASGTLTKCEQFTFKNSKKNQRKILITKRKNVWTSIAHLNI